jgi:hypothetical protein
MNWQLRVGPLPLTALTIHILSYDIFVGNTYYAIATFGTKIGSGEMLLGSQKTELVTPCCHIANLMQYGRYDASFALIRDPTHKY